MKNVILGSILLSTLSFSQENYFNLKVGTEFVGKYSEIKGIENETEGLGGVVSLEYTKPMNKYVDLGVGISYQQHADRKETVANMYGLSSATVTGITYTSVPVYLTGKLNIPVNNSFAPYVIGHVGYSFNRGSDADIAFNGEGYWNYELSPNVKDGVYAGVGVGFVYNSNWTFDIMYQINKAEDDNGNNIDYKRAVALIGFKF